MKLSSAVLQIAALLGGGGKSIIIHAGVCTEMTINPTVGSNVNMNACLNIGIESCNQSNDSCTKFGDLFGTGWRLLDDVTEQMADVNDETKGRLPAYSKMVKNTRMYLYYEVDTYLSDGGCGGGKWVFGTKVGGGGGVDFGQARDCKGVPSTCMTWGFSINTGGLCDSSRIGDGTFDSDRNSDRSLPYQRSNGITYSMKADGMSTKLFSSTYTSSCRSMSGLNGDGVQVDNPRDIVFNFQCTSSDLAGTISYEDVSGLQRRPCLAEYTDFPDYTTGHYEFDTFTPWAETLFPPDGVQDSAFVTDDCRTSRCQGSPQAAGSYSSAVPGSERDCLDPNHYWETCGCLTPGWVDRMITINGRFYHSGNFEMGSIMDDPNLNLGPSPSTTTVATTTTTQGTTTSSIITTIASTSTASSTTSQAMGICVNAGSMDGESCPDAAACGCTRRNLLDHEELEVDDQEEDGMEDIKSNLRQRELQRGCKCQPNRGKFCCPTAGETCESDGECRAQATTTLPVTTIGSTTTVPQTTSTTTQAVCTCDFGTTSTESPPATTESPPVTTTTLPPPQSTTTASSCDPGGGKCQEVSRCCNGCQDSGRKADRQCL